MKKLLSALLALTAGLCLTVPALAAEAPAFSDVPEDHWAYSYVQRAALAGVVNGTSGGQFSPDKPLTLAEFTAMVLRGVYGEEPEHTGAGQWYSAYTTAADALGLYEGTDVAERFAGSGEADYDAFLHSGIDWEATRYTMAVMMYRAAVSGSAGLPYTEEEIQSARDWAERGAEVAIGDWVLIPAQYRESVTFCFRCGLLEGMDSLGSFNGEDTVTRAQAAAVLCRVLDAKEGPEDSAADDPDWDGPLMPNGRPMTEENVRAAIEALKSEFPEGMEWTNASLYQSHALRTNGYGCAGFALRCSDTAFGDLPVSRKHSSFDEIRVGDMLRVHGNTHSVIVLEKKADSVIIAEGNYSGLIHWGRELARESLETDQHFYVETRYPKDA